LSDVNGHYSRQAKNYDTATTSARISVKQRDAVSLWRAGKDKDADLVLYGNDSITSEVKRLASLNGMPTEGEGSEIYRDSLRTKLSEVHSQVIGTMMSQGDWEGSKSYLDRVASKDELDPEDFTKLNNALRKNVIDDTTARMADSILDRTQGYTLIQRLDAVREYYEKSGGKMTSDMRDAISTRIRQRDKDERDARSEQVNSDMNAAQEFLSSSNRFTVDDIQTKNPDLYERLYRNGKLPDLRAYSNSNNRFVTDAAALDELDALAEMTEPRHVSVPKFVPTYSPDGEVTGTERIDIDTVIHPLRDRSDAEIRAEFGSRLSPDELRRQLERAQNIREGKDGRAAHRGQARSMSPNERPTASASDAMFETAVTKAGFMDPETGKASKGNEKIFLESRRDFDIFVGTPSIMDGAGKEPRLPNAAEMQSWLDTRFTRTGSITVPGWFSDGSRQITEQEYKSLPPDQQATFRFPVTVAGKQKDFYPSKIPQAELVDITRQLTSQFGGLAFSTQDVAEAYLRAHGNMVPGEVAPTSITAAYPGVSEKEAARRAAYDLDVANRDAIFRRIMKDSEPKSAAQATESPWLYSKEEVMQGIYILGRAVAEEPAEGARRMIAPAYDKTAEALDNFWAGTKDVAQGVMDWAFGDSVERPKRLADGSMNPEYVAELRSFARWHKTGTATDSFNRLASAINSASSDVARGQLGRGIYDKNIKAWIEEVDPSVANMPQSKARRLLYDIVRDSADPKANQDIIWERIYFLSGQPMLANQR
jgi:hypothetical protein